MYIYIYLYIIIYIYIYIHIYKLTWWFEHSGDISCSLLVNPSHTDESWERRKTCMYIYIHICTYSYGFIQIYIY